jgi:hypothetical protein
MRKRGIIWFFYDQGRDQSSVKRLEEEESVLEVLLSLFSLDRITAACFVDRSFKSIFTTSIHLQSRQKGTMNKMKFSSLALPILGLLPSLSLAAPSIHNSSSALRTCVEHVFQTEGGNATQRIVDPSMDTYTDARLGEKIQFDEFPALIAYAVNAEEVRDLVRCARKTGYKAVPRTGGHQ